MKLNSFICLVVALTDVKSCLKSKSRVTVTHIVYSFISLKINRLIMKAKNGKLRIFV